MKNLKDILFGVSLESVAGTTNYNISAITTDSRMANKDTLFVAIKGTAVDGHNFINQVIENGTQIILCEQFDPNWSGKANFLVVSNTRKALGILASNFYDNPSTKLKLVGVTGTNGKTTTTTILYDLFKKLGYKVGLLSTIQNLINEKVYRFSFQLDLLFNRGTDQKLE